MVQVNAASGVVLAVVALNAANTLAAPVAQDVEELVVREPEPEPVKIPGLSKITHTVTNAIKHHKAKPKHSTGTEKIATAVSAGQLGVDVANSVKSREIDVEFDLFEREDDESLFERDDESIFERDDESLFERDYDSLFEREPVKVPVGSLSKVAKKVGGAVKNAIKHHKAKPHHSTGTEKISTAISAGELGVDIANSAKQPKQRSLDEDEFEVFAREFDEELMEREPLKLPIGGLSKIGKKIGGALKKKGHKKHHSSKTEKVQAGADAVSAGADVANAAQNQRRDFDDDELSLFTRAKTKKTPSPSSTKKTPSNAPAKKTKQNKKPAKKNNGGKKDNQRQHSSTTDKVNTAVDGAQLGLDVYNTVQQSQQPAEGAPARREIVDYELDLLD